MTDFEAMLRALTLAENAWFHAAPNPAVGCVIVKDGLVITEGWTQPPGQDHAEKHALAHCQQSTVGATAYVTLEPCNHFGRTPPCVDALIAAGVSRVVCAMQDPNPLVAGRGIARLREAGIVVEVGLLEREACALNPGFISRMIRKRPWIRSKIAMSLDGRSALANGESQWITGVEARADGHIWRARASAIFTGMGTVTQDNPALNVRTITTSRQPIKIVLDPHGDIADNAALWQGAPVWIVTGDTTFQQHQRAEKIIPLPRQSPDSRHLALSALPEVLGSFEINDLHLEAGAKLNGAMLNAGLIDELLLYVAPSLLGDDARSITQGLSLAGLNARTEWQWLGVEQIGSDLRLRLVHPNSVTLLRRSA